jgi:hypothetical protein
VRDPVGRGFVGGHGEHAVAHARGVLGDVAKVELV